PPHPHADGLRRIASVRGGVRGGRGQSHGCPSRSAQRKLMACLTSCQRRQEGLELGYRPAGCHKRVVSAVGGSMTLSARNHLKGKIEEIQKGDVLVHVTVRVGDNQIESVITKRSADEMALKEGDSVTAVVKATEVMLSKPCKQ